MVCFCCCYAVIHYESLFAWDHLFKPSSVQLQTGYDKCSVYRDSGHLQLAFGVKIASGSRDQCSLKQIIFYEQVMPTACTVLIGRHLKSYDR